ncbi:MAG TPA: thiamine-binding protein [Mycobacteriales bacterium]
MLVEIQCLPTPAGTADDPHAHVEAAIRVIQASGLAYEVGALGTTLEGEPDEVWPLLRRIHEACLAAGADREITLVKVLESPARPLTMEGLTRKFR